jgi:bifunctional UDP-N-acetylglucosamine pyrophosphorylase/glucosamine-1-phosphate N-acetyltransferase
LNLSYPWDLLNANETFLLNLESNCLGIIEEGTHIQGPCVVGANTRIRAGSYIVGPVIIGQNCDIGPNCYVRAATAIGDGCHIGASVEIKNAIIMAGTKIPHQSYVGDSIIGEKCNLGAGTKIANLRFDHRNIKIGQIDSGRRKLGAIIGNNVQTGINTSIDAGTMIGDDVYIWPGTKVNGSIEAGSKCH